MIEVILYLLLSLAAGILVGLLPGIGTWVPLMLMMPFILDMPVWSIVSIWLAVMIGSQYFGSVSVILLKIPGESSGLVYLRDVDSLNTQQRLDLIGKTARGSFVASVVALSTIFAIEYFDVVSIFATLSQNIVKLFLFSFITVMLVYAEKNNRTMAAGLFLLGLLLADKTDESLPSWIYYITDVTYYISPMSVVVGLLVLPEMFREGRLTDLSSTTFKRSATTVREYWLMFKGGLIGMLGGLVPGNGATFSALAAYNIEAMQGSDIKDRIISTESADNSAVITGTLPLLLTGIPITISSVLLVAIFDIKMFSVIRDFNAPLLGTFNFAQLLIVLGLAFSTIYLILSQKFLGFYQQIVYTIYQRRVLVYILIAAWVIWADSQVQDINWMYFAFVAILTAIGVYLNNRNISSIPLVIGYFLGDEIFWNLRYFQSIL